MNDKKNFHNLLSLHLFRHIFLIVFSDLIQFGYLRFWWRILLHKGILFSFSFSISSKICLEFGILEYDFLRSNGSQVYLPQKITKRSSKETSFILGSSFWTIVSIIFRKFISSRRRTIVNWLQTDLQLYAGVPDQTGDSCWDTAWIPTLMLLHGAAGHRPASRHFDHQGKLLW